MPDPMPGARILIVEDEEVLRMLAALYDLNGAQDQIR